MAPLIPRMHLFEIDDQPWFPPVLRAHVQSSLTSVWRNKTPFQIAAPADIAASILIRSLGTTLSSWTFIDFCAGGGGPSPSIERAINGHLRKQGKPLVDFVLTDLHPHIEAWEELARKNPRITYEKESIDASNVPSRVVQRADGKSVMRLFNLAFHHFDDPLATAILKNTVETSQGFAIFELQDRSLASFITNILLGIVTVFQAPYDAWRLRSWVQLVFSWFIPILPFVLVFDGYMSSLRTRTPEEVETLLRGCGADTSDWEIQSGSDRHLWPIGYVNWVVCKPVNKA